MTLWTEADEHDFQVNKLKEQRIKEMVTKIDYQLELISSLKETILSQAESKTIADKRYAELSKELQDKEKLCKSWISYAIKIEMLMPNLWDSNSARDMGWSTEYLKGYNDAIREVKKASKKAREK